MLSSVAAVLFVFCLLGAALFGARRLTGGATGVSLSVVDAVTLGSGRSVTVVRSGERYFLLGATSHSISLLAELDAGDVADLKQAPARTGSLGALPAIADRIRSLRNAR